MTTAATSLLGLALPVTGELAGTWGTTVNDSITSLLDTAVAGTTTLSTDGDVTLTTTTLASNQARQAILLCSGARTALRTITAPAQSKIYTIINATTGGFSVKLVGVGPTTGLTIPNGASAVVAWNGSDFIEIGSSTVGNLTVNGNLTVTGTTTLTGAATLTANPTLSAGTANGVAYLNGSKVVTTGSALTFDGTNALSLGSGGSASTATSLTLNATDNAANGSYIIGKRNGTNAWLIGDTASSLGTGTGFTSYNYGTAPWIWYLQTGGEQMRLISTGLGIGTSSPGEKLDVAGNVNATLASSVGKIVLRNSSTTSSELHIRPNSGKNGWLSFTEDSVADRWIVGVKNGNGSLFFNTGSVGTNTDRMVLDSSGNLGLGVTPSAWNSVYKTFQLGAAASVSGRTDNNRLYIWSNVFVDSSGGIKYINSDYASYYKQQDGQHQWFYAASGTAGTTATFTQAMTLDASGRLLIGNTTNSNGEALQIDANGVGSTLYTALFRNTSTSTSVYNAVRFLQGASGSAIGYIGTGGSAVANAAFANNFVVGTQSSSALVFNTNDTERARIDTSGNFGVGTTTLSGYGANTAKIYQKATGTNIYQIISQCSANDSAVAIGHNGSVGLIGSTYGTTGSYLPLAFYTSDTERARIDSSGNFYIEVAATTASAANMFLDTTTTPSGQVKRSTSALKYKQDIRDLEEYDIGTFRPVRYKSACDGDDQTVDHLGFIADWEDEAGHKELVSYGKDGEVEGFQYDRMTAILTKVVQQQNALIKELLGRVAALEAK